MSKTDGQRLKQTITHENDKIPSIKFPFCNDHQVCHSYANFYLSTVELKLIILATLTVFEPFPLSKQTKSVGFLMKSWWLHQSTQPLKVVPVTAFWQESKLCGMGSKWVQVVHLRMPKALYMPEFCVSMEGSLKMGTSGAAQNAPKLVRFEAVEVWWKRFLYFV